MQGRPDGPLAWLLYRTIAVINSESKPIERLDGALVLCASIADCSSCKCCRQHQAISTEFSQTNKFEDWATQCAMEKLANSATAALHEWDELQKWLQINANKQKRAKAAKKPAIRFLLKVCNLPTMQNFKHISQGATLRTWPTPTRRSSPFKPKLRSGGKNHRACC